MFHIFIPDLFFYRNNNSSARLADRISSVCKSCLSGKGLQKLCLLLMKDLRSQISLHFLTYISQVEETLLFGVS